MRPWRSRSPLSAAPAQARFLIAGNDQKLTRNDDGKPALGPPGADTVSVIDVGTDPARPRIVASLPIENSVVGPPTNIVVTPDETLALVADWVDVVGDGDALQQVPDSKVHVIDLTASPPAALGTVEVGGQPSGMAIDPRGHARAERQPRRQVGQRARDPRQGGAAGRGRRRGRRRGRGGLRARRAARLRGQVPGPQARGARR